MTRVPHRRAACRPARAAVDGVFAQDLVKTSPASWAETRPHAEGAGQVRRGHGQEGPVALGAVATVTRGQPPPPAPSPSPSAAPRRAAGPRRAARQEGRPRGRVRRQRLRQQHAARLPGQPDLFLNSVAWLAEDADLISIRPKEPDDQRLVLTRSQQQNLAVLALAR